MLLFITCSHVTENFYGTVTNIQPIRIDKIRPRLLFSESDVKASKQDLGTSATR